MRLAVIALCACVVLARGDVAHLRTKARLVGQLAKHKRGVLTSVPSFKLGHDIPHVTHSVVKPFVVTYPPTAAVTAVKVPLGHPLIQRYPVPVGHRVPVPHPHYGLKFHHHTKGFVLPKPDQHFHHHHHHLAPRPAVPVLPPAPVVPATPVIPVAQPSGIVPHPIPAPSPPLFVHPSPVAPTHPIPVSPPPLHVLPPHHAHINPFLTPEPVPVQPANIASVFPVAPQYVIRPGNAIQTSFFATYPRYPLVNYPQLFPLTAPAVPPIGQVLLNRPQVPHFHLAGHEILQPTPTVAVEPTPTLLHPTQVAVPQPAVHLHPTQAVPLDHDGWAPVPTPHDLPHTQPEAHFHQGADAHFHDSHHFTQEQGEQFVHHTDDQQYHEYQHQLQHHVQQQIDQAQYEQHLNQYSLSQEYGAPQHVSQEYGQPNQEYPQRQEYDQHGQEYAQQQEYAQHEFAHQHLGQEYGAPHQEVEGRSIEGEEDTQRYHNHIPLGLQPPINRPLEPFR